MSSTARKIESDPARFPRASSHDPARKDSAGYHQRTQRNGYWLGGEAGQERLAGLKVGVAGLGGMGSNIAEALTRLGVGHLRIADPDTIERTNLNRQVIAHERTIGVPKAHAARSELRGIAQDFELVTYDQGITAETVEEFVEGCDAIVDEIDVFPLEAHILLHKAARKRGIPLYSAYAVGYGTHFYKFHGNAYTFENFLGDDPALWRKPTADYLLEVFGPPYAPYFDRATIQGFSKTISTGGAPIFGPTCLLGHSVVSMRLILDCLASSSPRPLPGFPNLPPTPVMPEFLVLDVGALSFRVESVKRGR